MSQSADIDALRQEVAAVVYRELGDMVNRDYLIDGLMSVIEDMARAWDEGYLSAMNGNLWNPHGGRVAPVWPRAIPPSLDTP